MSVWCKHVHELELWKFLNFCVEHLPVKRDMKTKFPYFLFREKDMQLWVIQLFIHSVDNMSKDWYMFIEFWY